jgi:hypothetical protein
MDRLILEAVRVNQVITVLTGEGRQDFRYRFVVKKAGELPLGLLFQKNPDGLEVGPGDASLLGCGRRTTPRENPMQRVDWFIGRPTQEVALTIGWGVLYVGGCAVVRDPNSPDNTFYELQPVVTDIQLTEC